MTEVDVNEDPSVRLTAVAEKLAQSQQQPDRWALFRKVAVGGAAIVVCVTCAMVGFVVYQQATSSENAAVQACRSGYSADVQVGIATAFADLAQSAVESNDDEFDQRLLSSAEDLLRRAEAYQAAAKASADPDSFLEQCRERG